MDMDHTSSDNCPTNPIEQRSHIWLLLGLVDLGQTQFCGMEGTENVASALGLWVWTMLRIRGLGFEGRGHSMGRGSEGMATAMGPWV